VEGGGATGDIDVGDAEAAFDGAKSEVLESKPLWGGLAAACFAGAFLYAFVGLVQDVGIGEALKVVLQKWLLVVLIGMIVIYGFWRGVKVYDALIEGAREGFDVALRIIPYLVAILVAVGMLRASGALDLITDTLAPLTALVGMPAEVFPMGVLRTLSGTGAFAMSSELMTAHGPDSMIGLIASTMQGSTETTFYVLALYFGVVRVKETRHALPVCLIADTVGALSAVWACKLLLG
jgi:spore maturation protein B